MDVALLFDHDRRECNMHKLRCEFKVDHLCRQVLSPRVVDCKAAVFAACDQQIACLGVGKRSDCLVELSEVTRDTSLLDVEHAHRACLETT